MFEVSVQEAFSAAHFLTHCAGKCERLHGHNWTVQVCVRGSQLTEAGLLVDFHDLKAALKKVLEPMDHVLLNEIEAFSGKSVSSEAIAKFVYDRMVPLVETEDRKIHKVTVWEGPTSASSYLPG